MDEARIILKESGKQTETPLGASSNVCLAGSLLKGFAVKTIPLTQGKVALVDDEDFKRLNQWKWCAAKRIDGKFYAVRTSGKGKTISMHRLIMHAKKDEKVDHKYHNELDNRKYNLRIASTAENQHNQQTRNTAKTSKYKGVYWHKGGRKWAAHIKNNHNHYHLGLFVNEKEAAFAYDAAAQRYFGEFALLNFPK